MKKDEISRLLELYLSAKSEGKEPYFDSEQIDELLDSFEMSKDYNSFNEVLALGLKLHPNNTDLLIRKAMQLADELRYEEAFNLIRDIADTDNQDLDSLKMECYCALDQYHKAVEMLEELMTRNCPYLEELCEDIATVLNDIAKYKEAHDFINRCLHIFPKSSYLKNELCYTLKNEGDYQRAIKLCNELLDQKPYTYELWSMLGELYAAIGSYEKAIEAFDFAITCNDDDVELKISRAYCLYMNNSYEKALEEYQAIEGDEYVKKRIFPLMAECYARLERYEEAYQLFSQIADDPDIKKEATDYFFFIRSCEETERYAEAKLLLRKAIEIYPNSITLLSYLAIHLFKEGRNQEALSVANKVFQLSYEEQSDPATRAQCEKLLLTGEQAFERGEIKKAIACYKKALEINPDTPMVHLLLAMAYSECDDMDNFLKHYELTSDNDVAFYFQKHGAYDDILPNENKDKSQNIPVKDLVKDFLNNKENRN